MFCTWLSASRWPSLTFPNVPLPSVFPTRYSFAPPLLEPAGRERCEEGVFALESVCVGEGVFAWQNVVLRYRRGSGME